MGGRSRYPSGDWRRELHDSPLTERRTEDGEKTPRKYRRPGRDCTGRRILRGEPSAPRTAEESSHVLR